MSGTPQDIEATMLLCDDAQAVGGKLYVLGGGWSVFNRALVPRARMALAVKLAVPWSRANERIDIEAHLLSDQGQQVEQPTEAGDQPVRAEGQMEVGRPPGLRHGTPLDAVFVLNFDGLDLPPGGYVWELRLSRELAARAPFQVISTTP